jgi:hypothetical protein
LGSRSNQRRRSRSRSRGSRSGSRGGRSASRGSGSAGVEEDAQHLGVPAPGGAPARRWTSKAGNGEDRQRCTPPRLATNRLRSLTRGWNSNEQGEQGRGGAPSPYIDARDFAGPHLRAHGEVSPSRASPRQPPRRRAGGGEIAPRAPRAAALQGNEP